MASHFLSIWFRHWIYQRFKQISSGFSNKRISARKEWHKFLSAGHQMSSSKHPGKKEKGKAVQKAEDYQLQVTTKNQFLPLTNFPPLPYKTTVTLRLQIQTMHMLFAILNIFSLPVAKLCQQQMWFLTLFKNLCFNPFRYGWSSSYSAFLWVNISWS